MARTRRDVAKRGRLYKTPAQKSKPSPAVPNHGTEMPVNVQDVNSDHTTSVANIQENRRENASIIPQSLNPSPAAPYPQTETLENAQDVNCIGTPRAEKRRKSERYQRPSSPTPVDGVQPVGERIIVTEVEKELPINENQSHEGTQNAPATEPSPAETTGMASLNYRSMYIDSQKKVSSLMKKNRKLRKNLESALGKIEVYDAMRPIISSLTKSNEILCNRPWNAKRFRT